jgi:hypothetical protein
LGRKKLKLGPVISFCARASERVLWRGARRRESSSYGRKHDWDQRDVVVDAHVVLLARGV